MRVRKEGVAGIREMLFNAELMPRRRRGGMGWETWRAGRERRRGGSRVRVALGLAG